MPSGSDICNYKLRGLWDREVHQKPRLFFNAHGPFQLLNLNKDQPVYLSLSIRSSSSSLINPFLLWFLLCVNKKNQTKERYDDDHHHLVTNSFVPSWPH